MGQVILKMDAGAARQGDPPPASSPAASPPATTTATTLDHSGRAHVPLIRFRHGYNARRVDAAPAPPSPATTTSGGSGGTAAGAATVAVRPPVVSRPGEFRPHLPFTEREVETINLGGVWDPPAPPKKK